MFISSINAQDSTRSEAFKHPIRVNKHSFIKNWYPPYYSLMLTYILKEKANDGDVFAQHELGVRYLLGKGFSADTIKATHWIKRAVIQNLPPARFNYAIMLYNQVGEVWDPFESFKQFHLAATAGMPEAQFALGLYYTDNLVVNRNINEAYKWVKLAADANHEKAKSILKKLEKQGAMPVTHDPSKQGATYYYKTPQATLIEQDWEYDYLNLETEEKTSEEEVEFYSSLLKDEDGELKQLMGIQNLDAASTDFDTAGLGLVKYSARNGSPEALMLLGKLFGKGIEVEQNRIEAAEKYLRSLRVGSGKAAEHLLEFTTDSTFYPEVKDSIDAGSAKAMYVWAGLAALGIDYQIDSEQAFNFLLKACDKKHVPALIETGLCYSSGSLVEKDNEKAIEYWQRAAALGSREAEVRIALFNLLEKREDPDRINYITLENAANEGSVLAQAGLGYCYENGLAVKQNKGTAANYYRVAANRGSRTAYNSLVRMHNEIRPEDEMFRLYESN